MGEATSIKTKEIMLFRTDMILSGAAKLKEFTDNYIVWFKNLKDPILRDNFLSMGYIIDEEQFENDINSENVAFVCKTRQEAESIYQKGTDAECWLCITLNDNLIATTSTPDEYTELLAQHEENIRENVMEEFQELEEKGCLYCNNLECLDRSI